jgi:chitodextrinase
MRTAAVTLLLLLGLAAPAHAYRLEGARWSGHTVGYYNTAKRYKVEVVAAAKAWNRSGVKFRFRSVSRARAQIVIDVNSHISSAGLTTYHGAGRYLSYARIDLQPDVSPGWTAPIAKRAIAVAVIAHEMGHALGLDHEPKRCATMNAVLWSFCAEPPNEWQVHCRPLENDDIRGAIHIYGGKLRKVGPLYCDEVSQPPPPVGLTVTAGPYGVAHLTWTMPATGVASVRVLRSLGTCPTGADDKAATIVEELPATAGAALTLDDQTAPGHYCYAVVTIGAYERPSALATLGYDALGQPPQAFFDYSATDPGNPLLVQFADESNDPDGQVVARTWSFGDGTTATGPNPAHMYPAAGQYTVTLTVTDNTGQSATTTQTVYVG